MKPILNKFYDAKGQISDFIKICHVYTQNIGFLNRGIYQNHYRNSKTLPFYVLGDDTHYNNL